MSIKKGSRKKEKMEDQMFKFIFYSFIYAIFIGLMYGSVQMNLGTVQVAGWIWMSFEQMFLIIGLAGWALLSLFIWKGKISLK